MTAIAATDKPGQLDPRRWLTDLSVRAHAVCAACWRLHCSGERRRRHGATVSEAHIAAALPDWSLAMVVHALQALRGMALVAAATLVAELGDITRFSQANPRQADWVCLACVP